MRASQRARDRTLAQLGEGYACGELHTGTFSHRVDAALRAASEGELRGLTNDLPVTREEADPGRLRRALRRAVPRPAPPSLLESAGSGRLTIGRHPDCEVVLEDDTVSRRHALLCRRDGRWYLRDLGSSNGTWVNGRRVFDAEVLPGDEVALGEARFRL